MDRLEEIRQKLLAGQEAKELVKAGYARTSVYMEAKKLRAQLPAADDELADLKRQKEVLKVKAEIADIMALKEKLPDRVTALEAEVVALRKLIRAAINRALEVSFTYTGQLTEPTPEIKDICRDWVERVVEAP